MIRASAEEMASHEMNRLEDHAAIRRPKGVPVQSSSLCERSLRRALREYVEHFHAERNHQGKGNVLLFPRETDIRRAGSMQCRKRLGGFLRHYHREVAETGEGASDGFFDLTGYDRIVRALANLGYTVCDPTVGNVPQRHGLLPASERKRTTTWSTFIRIHLALLSLVAPPVALPGYIIPAIKIIRMSRALPIRFRSKHIRLSTPRAIGWTCSRNLLA
jgi:hypothetical protein